MRGKRRWTLDRGLWSLLFCLLPLLANAQDRPGIVWMAGGHSGSVNSVAFSPDGSTLASGSGDRTIKLWRVSDGALIRTLTAYQLLRGCLETIYRQRAAVDMIPKTRIQFVVPIAAVIANIGRESEWLSQMAKINQVLGVL